MKDLEVKNVPAHILGKEVVACSECWASEHNPMAKRLKATWEEASEPGGEPSTVTWEDGRATTLEDFHGHELDTHFWAQDDDGRLTKYMFPEIQAEVVFDQDVSDWIVRGQGVVTTALDLADPNALDESVVAALFNLEMVYRSRIIR
jgi:hypothetical protein